MGSPDRPPASKLYQPAARRQVLPHRPATTLRRGASAAVDQALSGLFTVGLVLLWQPLLGDLPDVWVSQLFIIGTVLTSGLCAGLFEGSAWQATPGKKLLGLRVIRLDGNRVCRARALRRNLFKSLGLSTCGIIVVTVFHSQGRSIWDRAAGTMVVHPD